MRFTLNAWWCRCGQRNEPSVKACTSCTSNRIERHAQVHASERAVVYVHPLTGERRTPPRADQSMPEVYAAQGFERQEIMSMTAFEKQTGLVHEATNFAPGSEPMPAERHTEAQIPREVREGLIKDIMDAHQSGNWTMDRPLVDATA